MKDDNQITMIREKQGLGFGGWESVWIQRIGSFW